MARATLKVRSNEGLVALSEAHPSARFTVRGAWPTGERLRLLVETADVDEAALRESLAALSAVEAFEILGADSRRVRFEVATPPPGPHGAMTGSGIVPPFPLTVEDGWITGDLVASRERLSQFRDELSAAGIDYRLVCVSASDEPADLLTDRQREVVEAALARGYYESPRECTLTELAAALGVHKSVVSRVLHRAEGRLVAAYCSSSDHTGEPAGVPDRKYFQDDTSQH